MIKKRRSHKHTSLTFKLDLSKVLNQCWQTVKAYAGSAFPPWGAGSEKFIALRHRSVICLPHPISNPESSTSGLVAVLGSAFGRKSNVEPWRKTWKTLNRGNREDRLSSACFSISDQKKIYFFSTSFIFSFSGPSCPCLCPNFFSSLFHFSFLFIHLFIITFLTLLCNSHTKRKRGNTRQNRC